MATPQIHQTGAEYILKNVITGNISRVTSITVGLYNDSTDSLSHTSDYSDITSEPSTGNYSSQSVDLDANSSASLIGDNWSAVIGEVTFDCTDTTETVDSYYIVISVQLAGDGSPTQHLFWTGALDQTYDLEQIKTFKLEADTAGVKILPDTS